GGFEREPARFGKQECDDDRVGYREQAQISDHDRQTAKARGEYRDQGLGGDRRGRADQREPSHHRASDRGRKKFGRQRIAAHLPRAQPSGETAIREPRSIASEGRDAPEGPNRRRARPDSSSGLKRRLSERGRNARSFARRVESRASPRRLRAASWRWRRSAPGPRP